MSIDLRSLFDNEERTTRRATRNSELRRSGTVPETLKHSLIHTSSPDATLHHCIISACHHLDKKRANRGDYYMVAYVSIPLTWLASLNDDIAERHNVSFIGPSGMIQRFPPVLADMEDLINNRIYIGFDWNEIQDTKLQPNQSYIKQKLINFVNEIRELNK